MFRKQIRLEELINWLEFKELAERQRIKSVPANASILYAKIHSPQFDSFSCLLNALEEDKRSIRLIRPPSLGPIRQVRHEWKEKGTDLFPIFAETAEKDKLMFVEYSVIKVYTDKGRYTLKDVLRFEKRDGIISCFYAFIRRESLENYTLALERDFPEGDYWYGICGINCESKK